MLCWLAFPLASTLRSTGSAAGSPALFVGFPAAEVCGARSRKGKPCPSPAVKGKRRCRMHGSRAPKGERNGNYRHGYYTYKAIVERRALMSLTPRLWSRP